MERNCILPDDLVEDILSRLPIKDLLRFRCVSKGWCALIDDVSFIRKHYQVQYSFRKLDDNMTYFVDHFPFPYVSIDAFYLCSIQQGDVFPVHLTDDLKRDSKVVLPYGTDQYSISCHGCVNGIICLTWEYRKTTLINNCFLALWNPATRQFKTLAYPNVPDLLCSNHFAIFGFGFDLSSKDFKILGRYDVVLTENEANSYYFIFSLKSNSWKRISNPPADIRGLPPADSDAYLNGVYYWTIDLHEKTGCPLRFVIVSFNFSSGVFKVSDLPQDAFSLVSESYPCQMAIALYKERLALVISYKVQEEALYSIRIWIATQFDNCGVPLSWQNLFTIGPTPAILGLVVDTILMNGDLQLSFEFPNLGPDGEDYGGREVYLYNHSKGEFKKFDFWWKAWFRYVESLFPLSMRLVVQT